MYNKFYSIFLKLIFITSIIVSFSCSDSKNSNLPKIGIVQIEDDPVLDAARLSAIEALEKGGFKDGKNIIIDYKNAQGDLSNLPLILKSFNSPEYKLIITNSTPCMVGAANIIKDKPIVITVSYSPEQLKMDTPQNMYGYYDPIDVKRLIEIIKSCVPNVSKIGIPFNPSEPNAVLAKNHIIDECKNHNIQVITQAANSVNDILPALQSLKNSNIDIIITAADNTMSLAMNMISDFANKNKLPLFTTDPLQTERGAAMGYGLNFNFWGSKSGELAAEILRNEQIEEPKIRSLTNYKLFINQNAVKSQGFNMPEDVKNSADKVIN